MFRFRSQTRIKLWQLLLVIAALGVVLGLRPQHIGIPIALLIEGALVLVFLLLFAAPWFGRRPKK